MAPSSKPVYCVQVRELVDFVLRRGDLARQGGFIAPGRLLAGTRGHQQVQNSRPPDYQKEVPARYEVEASDLLLRVQGRIDGLSITPEEVVLEEIKTVQNSWNRIADPLHWAQGKIYAFIYAHDHGLEKITIRLIYLELETGGTTEFGEVFSASELSAFFHETIAVYLEWIQERHRWVQQRDQSIHRLEFPFPRYRAGQRELAVAVYRALAGGGRLFVEAATGIGKTISVLFPGLKALAEGKMQRIFYLTARTVGRIAAEKAFTDLRQAGLSVRTVALTAKEKLCLREGVKCDLSTCPWALGYYDRCKPAIREALAQEAVTRSVLEAVGRQHRVCPFELSLDVSSWVDAVICDYNYAFDPKIYLRRHFAEAVHDYAFLVDEAHNLPERAREMFSAELQSGAIDETRRAIQKTLPRCAKNFGRLSLAMRKLCAPAALPAKPAETEAGDGELNLFLEPGQGPDRRLALQFQESAFAIQELPRQLMPLLDEALKEAELWLARNEPAEFREMLLNLYFGLHVFRRTAGLYDDRFTTIIAPGTSVGVRLFCIDPSHLLRQGLERATAAVFFSATLTPLDYYRSLIGGSPEDSLLQLGSPFRPENLATLVHDRIRTHFKDRADSLSQVVEAIVTHLEGRRGNYLVYFPSYQYLASVLQQFQAVKPSFRVLAQRPAMSETEREQFLAAFASEHAETLVGFAVMGGVFGEGIDLVGERLIGAAIVGVGLPQLSLERDLISRYFQSGIGAGFEYAYTFPGMNRVLQATGRVIRSETDRGAVLLIDARFGEQRYRRLFPTWWQPVRVRSAADIREAVGSFWQPSD